jgi:hypothetical protein
MPAERTSSPNNRNRSADRAGRKMATQLQNWALLFVNCCHVSFQPVEEEEEEAGGRSDCLHYNYNYQFTYSLPHFS